MPHVRPWMRMAVQLPRRRKHENLLGPRAASMDLCNVNSSDSAREKAAPDLAVWVPRRGTLYSFRLCRPCTLHVFCCTCKGERPLPRVPRTTTTGPAIRDPYCLFVTCHSCASPLLQCRRRGLVLGLACSLRFAFCVLRSAFCGFTKDKRQKVKKLRAARCRAVNRKTYIHVIRKPVHVHCKL